MDIVDACCRFQPGQTIRAGNEAPPLGAKVTGQKKPLPQKNSNMKSNFDYQKLRPALDGLSLRDLEARIKELHRDARKRGVSKNDPLKLALFERRQRIRQTFQYTPEQVRQIERVNRILTDGSAKVLLRAGQLYRQMFQLKSAGDEFLDDFEIEATVSVAYSGADSVLRLEFDENRGESDYEAMAEILDDCPLGDRNLRSFHFSYRPVADWRASDEALGIVDTMMLAGESWGEDCLDVPELRHVNFCYAAHCLFVDSAYSLSDIIRCNDFWNQVQVMHQNWGENQSDNGLQR
jgi:hypothetical protein